MNKFNSKINELKEKVEFNENHYYELKDHYDELEAEGTSKELELAALKSKNLLDANELDSKQMVIDENKSQIERSELRIKSCNERIVYLNTSINDLERKCDDLSLAYNQLTEELREIHQALNGD